MERASRSVRIEFWGLYDGSADRGARRSPPLQGYQFFFNYERPHASLVYRTPNDYDVASEAA